MKKALAIIVLWLLAAGKASANPYFYFDEGSNTVANYNHSVGLFIHSDSKTLTAARTIIDLPNTYLSYESILVADYPSPSPDPAGTKPNCFHSPLPPEWGLPAGATSPYLDEVTHKLYLSCGFTNPGYTTQSGGDKIATLTFFADAPGTDTISLESANTLFYYGSTGTTIGPGSQPSYQILVLSAVEPTPDLGEIPERATDSISEGDLQFVDIATLGSSGTTVTAPTTGTAGNSELTVVEEDNTIPPPPADLALRERLESLINRIRTSQATASATGEVLSLQSLRELLIPGKSDADRQVVVFNLISLFLFLLILGLITWKLVSQNRLHKAKTKHLSDLLVAELATLESKMGNSNQPESKSASQSIQETIKQISEEIKTKP